MRLSSRYLWKTTVFRHTVLYASLFGFFSAILCLVVMLSATRFMEQQIDRAIHDELLEVQSDAAMDDNSAVGMKNTITGMVSHAPEWLYLLQDGKGDFIAGNMSPLRPVPGVRLLTHSHRLNESPSSKHIRGEGLLLANGDYLFIGSPADDIAELQESLMRAFAWCILPVIALSLACGLVLSLRVTSKIERISATARGIMAGDLTQRIRQTGTGDEYDNLAAILNMMLDRICVLMTNLSQVTNDIAHDLRTPLSHLRQKVDLAASGNNVEINIEESLHEIDNIMETFSSILRIAQIESGSRRSGFAVVDLCHILANLAESYQVVAEENNQSILCVIVGCPLEISGDPSLLTQMFANLIENAITHSGMNSQITIEGRIDATMVRCTISDNGKGIPESEHNHIFQRFYRLEQSRTTPGNGLGLSMVAAIAGLHDGRIEIASRNPGIAFTVAFPLTT